MVAFRPNAANPQANKLGHANIRPADDCTDARPHPSLLAYLAIRRAVEVKSLAALEAEVRTWGNPSNNESHLEEESKAMKGQIGIKAMKGQWAP